MSNTDLLNKLAEKENSFNDEAIGRRYMRFDGPSFCMTYDESYGKSANGF